MYKVWVAYLLWLFGGFGCLGFHRFYLRKIPTGVIWLFTGGLCFVGAVYDFFTLASQVETANYREGRLRLGGQPVEVTVKREKEPLERTILRMAEKNNGRISAVQVAAASDWTLDQVKKNLDQMAGQGLCELRVLKSGGLVYHFADFDPAADREFEV